MIIGGEMKSLALLAFTVFSLPALADINVYTSRKEHLVKPVFDAFEKETKIKVRYLVDKEMPLIKKIESEANEPKADILITVDAGNLWFAAQKGILQPFDSKEIQKNIPAHLRDPGNRWFGYSVRARTLVYRKKTVNPKDLSTYEALSQKQWKDRVCLRTSKKVYNKSLVAMMISEHGAKKTESVVSGWVKNLATNPFSNDTRLIEAVAAGQCDVGIVNSYYYGRLLKKKPDLPVGIFWPNQKSNGVHVNVSGAGLVKNAPHAEDAKKFLVWLSGKKAQAIFANINLEYPANPQVKVDPIVAKWGTFKQNVINVRQAGENQAKAVMLMDRVGYK